MGAGVELREVGGSRPISDQFEDGWRRRCYCHCLWQFGLAFTLGPATARIWGDIHEAIGIVNQAERICQRMDRHNNEVGRRLASRIRTWPWRPWSDEAQRLCREALANGSLWIISRNQLTRANGRPLPVNRNIS